MIAVEVCPVRPIDPDKGSHVGRADGHGGDVLGAVIGQRNVFGRPQFKRDASAQINGVQKIQIHESLGADQGRVHAQVDGVAAGIDLVAERVDLAVTVGIRRLGRTQVSPEQGRGFGDIDHALAVTGIVGIQDTQQRVVIDRCPVISRRDTVEFAEARGMRGIQPYQIPQGEAPGAIFIEQQLLTGELWSVREIHDREQRHPVNTGRRLVELDQNIVGLDGDIFNAHQRDLVGPGLQRKVAGEIERRRRGHDGHAEIEVVDDQADRVFA